MDKTMTSYGIKQMTWRFSAYELENILRQYLYDKKEVTTSACDYSIKFDVDYNDCDGKCSIIATKEFPFPIQNKEETK